MKESHMTKQPAERDWGGDIKPEETAQGWLAAHCECYKEAVLESADSGQPLMLFGEFWPTVCSAEAECKDAAELEQEASKWREACAELVQKGFDTEAKVAALTAERERLIVDQAMLGDSGCSCPKDGKSSEWCAVHGNGDRRNFTVGTYATLAKRTQAAESALTASQEREQRLRKALEAVEKLAMERPYGYNFGEIANAALQSTAALAKPEAGT